MGRKKIKIRKTRKASFDLGWLARGAKAFVIAAAVAGFAAVLVFGVHAYVTQDHYFDIASIEVSTNGSLKAETIRDLAGILQGSNLINLDLKAVAERLEQHSHIRKVVVRRMLPNRLRIEVEERRPIVQLHAGDNYFLLDQQGVVLSSAKKYPLRDLAILECAFGRTSLRIGNRFEGTLMQDLNRVFDLWHNDKNLSLRSIRRVDFDKTRSCTLILDRWVKVVLGKNCVKNLKSKRNELRVLLASDRWPSINYIDCRYKDVTVRWKR